MFEKHASPRLVEVLTEVIDTAIELSGADYSNIQLLEDDGKLKIVAQRNFPAWWVEYWNAVPQGIGACGKALSHGKRVIVEDIELSPIFVGTSSLDIQRRAGIRAVQSTPLRDRSGQWVGMLSTHYRVPHRPDPKTLKVLDLLAGHASTLIEHARMEQLLLENEERFRGFFENVAIGTGLINSAGRFIRVNDRYCALTGYSREELLGGMGPLDLDHPDDRKADGERLDWYLTGTVPSYVVEKRYLRKDGRVVWVHVSAASIFDQHGKLRYSAGVIEDITERKNTENQLAAKALLLELALSGAELGTWDVDLVSGQVLYDARYCAMLGYGIDEIEPTMESWLHRVHPDDMRAVEEVMRAHLAGETRIYEVEYRQRHKDGHWIWVLTRGKATYDSADRPVRATGTTQNINDRKRIATEGVELLKKFEAMITGLDGQSPRANTSSANPPSRSKIRLSGRNREVLQLIAEGMTSPQIAKELGIAEGTAASHRRNLMHKLGLKNKAAVIRYAIKHGIVADF